MFSVHAPPHVGHYKLEIYAASVPKTKGKLNLPIVATFMVEVRLKSHEAVAEPPENKAVQKHKLASIAEAFEVPSDSYSSVGMYPDTSPSPSMNKRDKSAGSLFSEFRFKESSKNHESINCGKGGKGKEDSDSRRTSAFSISSFIYRKLA